MPFATAAIPSAPLSPFRPAPEAAAAIFDRIASGRESLTDLAAAHNTSLEALALWLESPDAQQRLAAISTGLATFARIGALARIPAAASALSNLIDDFNARRALAAPRSPAESAPRTSSDDAPPVPSPMDDFRERRLIYSVACLLLRITRTPDRPRPATIAHAASSAPARDQSAHPHTHQPAPSHTPAHDASLRGMRPLSPDAAAIDPFAHQDRPAKSPGPADRLERLADPAARVRQSPEAWRAEVQRTIASVVEPEDLPHVLESMTQMDDELICEMLLTAAAEGRGQPPPDFAPLPAMPPGPGFPPPRHTPQRDSPGALLSAAGAPPGPAP